MTLACPPPIRVHRPPVPPNSLAWARHASIGGAPRALMAQANESRTLTLSRCRRSPVRSAYFARQANLAIPSAWLGPVLIGLGLSRERLSSEAGFPSRGSSARAAFAATVDAAKPAVHFKNARRSDWDIA